MKKQKKFHVNEIKEKEFAITEIAYEKNILSNNFSFDEYNSNLKAMKCANTLFTKNGLISNISSYILIFSFIIFIILCILFYKFGMYLIEKDIEKIISVKIKRESRLNAFKAVSKKRIKKQTEVNMSNPPKKTKK